MVGGLLVYMPKIYYTHTIIVFFGQVKITMFSEEKERKKTTVIYVEMMGESHIYGHVRIRM